MPKWIVIRTWAMLIIAFAVLLAALAVLGSTLGEAHATGAFSLSIPQVGSICAGVCALSIFLHCIKRLTRINGADAS
ncbi:hypothetical protein [Alteromonas sp. A079]|uniref:hypothetical protein n=1 Tax=Alteromonas sp. A079 TaxID=3410268 RepID=UPI003BA1027D